MTLSVEAAALVFVVSAAIIAIGGTKLVRVAEQLAADTKQGQAVFGAVFLGGATSLPGIVTSVTAAEAGHTDLAIGNAIGGITAQTVFLVLADVVHRRANLEHAAASLTNITWGAVLVGLLSLPVAAAAAPAVTIAGVHPISFVLVAAYVGGVRIAASVRDAPMWAPALTPETVSEPVGGAHDVARPWVQFGIAALIVGTAGLATAHAGAALAEHTLLTESIVGTYLTSIATSLPELVTVVVAVRRGALALAVGDILGGNTFDVLFVAASDVAWREGSIYHAVGREHLFTIAVAIAMTAVLLLGLVRRQKHGIGNIGFESALVLAIYGAAALLLTAAG